MDEKTDMATLNWGGGTQLNALTSVPLPQLVDMRRNARIVQIAYFLHRLRREWRERVCIRIRLGLIGPAGAGNDN